VGATWTAAQGAQPHSTVHQSLIRFFLRDLDNVRNPSYSLVAVKMGHGGPAVMAWFGQTPTVVIAPSVVWPDFNGSDSSFRRFSGSKNHFGGDGAGRGSSSMQRICARGSDEVVRRRRAAMVKVAWFWVQTHGGDLHL
jgi:hypothetical protein